MRTFKENVMMQEMNLEEMKEISGGGFFFGSAGSWFWKGCAGGMTAGGIGASIALAQA